MSDASDDDCEELESIRRLLENAPRVSAPGTLSGSGDGGSGDGNSGDGGSKHAGPKGAGHGELSREEREDLRRVLAAGRDVDERRRDHLTPRYERLATIAEPNDERQLLFVLDHESESELLVTRLAPALGHEVGVDGRLSALVRRLERLELATVARPRVVT
ncbi:MAG: hypothetical protein WD226_00470, partial [Planctomycetota bacterium]